MSMTLNDLEPQKYGFLVIFFANAGCDAHLTSKFWPTLLEICQDNLRTKLN